MTTLFDPYTLKSVKLRNRIAASPMCQYRAADGIPNDWHHIHLGGLARGGAALVVAEATAVSPEGRITPGCTGLWNEAQAKAFEPIVRAIKAAGAVPGLQLAHAGRKASANLPWEGDDHIAEDDPRGWEIVAPSAIAYGGGLHRVPKALSVSDIARIQKDFVSAAKRAREVGFEWLVLHFAHGYLAQSFFSQYSNQRTDTYGGSVENRQRFLVETVAHVRHVWPENLPLAARFGVLEFDGRDEETLCDSIELVKRLKDCGLDFIDPSIGFSLPTAKIPWSPAFMAPYAERVRREAHLPGAVSWNLKNPQTADAVIRAGQVDVVMLARGLLADPHWPFAAARALGVPKPASILPKSYSHWLERY